MKHIRTSRRILRNTERPNSILLLIAGAYLLWQLSKANHNTLQKLARQLSKHYTIGYYYLGLSYFLLGQNNQSLKFAKKFLAENPQHAEGHYLLADILESQGLPQKAFSTILSFSRACERKKTWLVMSNLVQSDEQFGFFYNSLKDFEKRTSNSILETELLNYLTNASLRSKNADYALSLWQNKTIKNHKKTHHKHAKLNKKNANTALRDLKHTLEKNEILFFLISGTLLGCMRENDFLSHDKDIDVGVWNTVSFDALKKAVSMAGCFYSLAGRSKHLLSIRHVNGVTIDIFIHVKEVSNYWHAGVKTKWNNTPFSLISKNFLGEQYLIPEDYDLYLTENYGDWRTPRINFDSAKDTPNIEIINQIEMNIYSYRQQHNND